MTAKEKVLKIMPDAICWCYYNEDTGKANYCISQGCDSSKMLSRTPSRESWAWAEAYRLLIPQPPK